MLGWAVFFVNNEKYNERVDGKNYFLMERGRIMPKILLIENNRDILYANRVMLELEGYEVNSAKDIEEGLLKITDTLPDLIVCDVPEPKSDWNDPTERFSPKGRFKFLFICDMETEKEKLEAIRMKGNDFVLKPYLMKNLIEKVHFLTEKNGGMI